MDWIRGRSNGDKGSITMELIISEPFVRIILRTSATATALHQTTIPRPTMRAFIPHHISI